MSDLFLDLTGKKPRLLDIEYDGEELHERCGGETYYVSCSGCSGAGWLKGLNELLRVGLYRVDTVYNNCQELVSLGQLPDDSYQEVLAAVPYRSHTEDKLGTLREYPTVVKIGNKVVYCDFEVNFADILKTIFSGGELPEKCEVGYYANKRRGHRTLKRVFTWLDSDGDPREEEVSMEFYNLCSMENTPDPWEFFQEELRDYRATSPERMYQLLGIEKLKDGTFVKTMKIAGERYRGEVLEGNPLEAVKLTAGWQRLADDVIVRFYDGSKEAHLVAYAPAKEAYGKLAQRLAHHMGESEEFISFVAPECGCEYIEFELTVPKVLFALDQTTQLADLRKGLAKKIREDVVSLARQWIKNINDQSILEAVPDDMVVTFEDSLEAGNCRPGTEDFVKQFFPGQAQTTAAELKKFAENHNVMRIFRHLAATGRFSCKAEQTAV